MTFEEILDQATAMLERRGIQQTWKPSPTSPRLLNCSRLCRTPLTEPATNSPSTSVSVLR